MKLTAIFLVVALLVTACNTPGPLPGNTGTIQMGNSRIYYERTGSSNETVILLHAGFLNTDMWKDQAQAFSKGFNVVAIDLPGHGRTENDTVRLFPGDFIKVVMDSLGISKAHLVGVSLGAGCVTDFIIAHPESVNKAVLVSSGLNGWEKKYEFDTAITNYFGNFFALLERKDTVAAAEIFTKMWFDGPYRKQHEVDSTARNYIYATTLGNMQKHHVRGWPIFADPTAMERISSINLPVMIIHGDKDEPQITKICTYLEQNIRGAKRILMPGVGHMLNMEAPEKFNEIVLNFLKE